MRLKTIKVVLSTERVNYCPAGPVYYVYYFEASVQEKINITEPDKILWADAQLKNKKISSFFNK